MQTKVKEKGKFSTCTYDIPKALKLKGSNIRIRTVWIIVLNSVQAHACTYVTLKEPYILYINLCCQSEVLK